MICVFDIIEGPARGKRFWLRGNQRMAVGRISTADFSIPSDSHMSRHHLILESNCDVIRLRDVGSANGTFVNESRINTLELQTGDKIRAGLTIFELSVMEDHADPHAKDGVSSITFSGRMTKADPQQGTVKGSLEPLATTSQPSNATTNELNELAGEATSQEVIPLATPLKGATRVVRYEELPTASQATAREPTYDDEKTLRIFSPWWMPFFKSTSLPHYFELMETSQAPHSFLDIAQRIPAANPLAFVVNLPQLGHGATEALQLVKSSILHTQLSNALMLVHCDGTPALWRLVEQAMQRDAIICLAAKESFEPMWLRELLDQLSYPSMMAGLLQANNAALQKGLLRHVAFAIFERNRSGKTDLYLNPERSSTATAEPRSGALQ